jgi:hypothetical protein
VQVWTWAWLRNRYPEISSHVIGRAPPTVHRNADLSVALIIYRSAMTDFERIHAELGRCRLSAGSCSSARQSRGGVAHCFYEVLRELQALGAEGTTDEVIFEDLTLLLG